MAKTRAKTKPKPLIAIEAPITITAAVSEGESKGPPTFDVVAYTGGALSLVNFEYPVVVDLAGVSFGKSLIANLDHDKTKRVGHVTATTTEEGQLTLSGKVSAATDAAREVVESSAKGFVWQASIEAQPDQLTEVKAGKTITVNGQDFNGPVFVAAKSTVKGFAFVSHGADDNTTVSIAAAAASSKEKKMKTEVKAWIESVLPSIDIEALSDDEVTSLEADYAGREGSRTKPTPKPSNIFAERKMERDRINGIREVANKFMDMRPDDIEGIERMHDHAIETKMTVQDFRNEMYESAIPFHTADSLRPPKRPVKSDVLEAALALTGGLKEPERYFSDQALQTAHDRFKNGIGLKQLYRIVAKANGYNHDDDDVTLDMHRYACGTPAQMIKAGAFSTISLPGMLGNTANKFLMEGWGGGEMVWRDVTAMRSVRDFKQSTSYKLNGYLKYEKVGASGEITHGTTTEESYTNQADTYGRMFAVTRRDIINDDLGALTSIPRELGYGANDAFNEVFWTVFLAGASTFFAGGNSNVSTGTVTLATVIATLTAAELIFFNQTKPNGLPLGILPDRILCPPAEYRIFLQAMNSTATSGSTSEPNTNTFSNNYSVHTSPYLSNAAYTGYSVAKWYLLCNPARLAVIETAFLNGREAPIVETADTSFNTLGVQFRGYHDFGCSLQETRAGVQGSGA